MLKEYTEKDNVQVAVAIENIVREVKKPFTELKETVWHGDDVSCLASQELVRFIYQLNAQSIVDGPIVIWAWIFT